jgi:hypothetical protein
MLDRNDAYMLLDEHVGKDGNCRIRIRPTVLSQEAVELVRSPEELTASRTVLAPPVSLLTTRR